MKRLAVLVLGAAAMLAACGGGDDAPPPATSQVPESAGASIGGFIAYLKELVVASADGLDPVDVSGVTPPADETSLPEVVD